MIKTIKIDLFSCNGKIIGDETGFWTKYFSEKAALGKREFDTENLKKQTKLKDSNIRSLWTK